MNSILWNIFVYYYLLLGFKAQNHFSPPSLWLVNNLLINKISLLNLPAEQPINVLK